MRGSTRIVGTATAAVFVLLTAAAGQAGGAFTSVLSINGAQTTHATIVVPRDFPTIQAAVNAAAPGDTINVRSGTYTEEVVIGKDLVLRGSGPGGTTIQSPATLTPFAINIRSGLPLTAIVRVGHGAQVRMSGLTVAGPVPCGLVRGVVVVQAATLDFSDARVSDIIQDPSCSGLRVARAVSFGLPPSVSIEGAIGTTAFGRVNNVAIDNYLDSGVDVVAPSGAQPTDVTLTNNVITSQNPQVPTEQFGVFVTQNAKARITGNTVTGAVCTIDGCGPDPINEFQSAGILVGPAISGTTVSDNHVSAADIGIYQVFASPNCCTISSNTLQDNRFFGIAIQDGDGTTRENTIVGGQVGIGVIADAVDTTGVLRGDSINGTTVAPVREIECCGFTATAIVTG